MMRFTDNSSVDSIAAKFGGKRTPSGYDDPRKAPNPDVFSYHFLTYDAAGDFAEAMLGSPWVVIGGHRTLFPRVVSAIAWPRNGKSSKYKRMMLGKYREGKGPATGTPESW